MTFRTRRAAKVPCRRVIYVFHANTNLGDTRNGGTVKAKVHVPRLDGSTVGALATRTPHRPLPVGEETCDPSPSALFLRLSFFSVPLSAV